MLFIHAAQSLDNFLSVCDSEVCKCEIIAWMKANNVAVTSDGFGSQKWMRSEGCI